MQVEWSASQNAGANTSTITARLYWMAIRSGVGAVYASSSDPASITINGNTDSISTNPKLSAGQKRLLLTHTVVVPHNADGSKTTTISAYFDVKATLSGTYVGRVSVSDSVTLNTIPRESSLSSGASFTAGANTTISINRASSSFRHEVDIYVKSRSGSWVMIKQRDFSTSQTSLSTAFSTEEVTEIFNVLDGRASADTRMVLDTYNGSTKIGSNDVREGTVTAPAASHPTTGYTAYWYTDDTVVIPITRANSAFTHTVKFIVGSFTKTITGVGTSVTWNPTTAEEAAMHNQIPNETHINGSIEVSTYYNGEQVRTETIRFIQFLIRDADPIFSGTVTYSDTNTAVTAITGNNQYIVQGKSNLKVTLSAASVQAQKGATMKTFIFKVAGESEPIAYTASAITVDFGTINAATNQTVTVEAVDSRGKTAVISKIVTVVPYSTPTLTTSAGRVNGFEETTTLTSRGTFSELKIATVPKNSLTAFKYRTRPKNGAWTTYTNIPYTVSGREFTGTNQSVAFDITKAYDIEFSVTDSLGTTTIIKSVGVGRPIFFIDDVLGSIAMNDFPKDPNTFLLNGRLTFAGNMYGSGVEGAVGGAIDLNNGDIVGANAIFFRDMADNSGEGLLFPKTGTTQGSSNVLDYDNFYVRNGNLFLNNRDFLEVRDGGSTGSLVRIGGGGYTIIGGGESSRTYFDGDSSGPDSERMVIANDSWVNIVSNLNGGYSSGRVWTFNNNGIMYRPVYKEGNGFNTVTHRVDPNHDSPVLIQESNIVIVSNGGASSADYTFPTAFDTAPEWIVTQTNEGSSVFFTASPYNVTATGARIYTQRVNGGTSTINISVQIVSCGKKA